MSGPRRRFRIIKEIAEGGFGKVYLAEQISSDGFSRIVACKLLHAKWGSHDEVVMRTRDEARLLGLIRHQHIVKVEDLTSIDGKCAIVMEYLEGCDLKWMMTYLRERDLEFPRAALFEIILATASALDAAYNGMPLQGGEPLKVIHRDIKPSNIFSTVAGGIKVLDFGTARANFAEREAKTQALAFGSQGYMAPERMLGEEDTPAADIFSLGITLYELLTLESFGRIPPRPNKFLSKVEDRVAAVPLDGDPEWCEQVRETLRLMLSYEPTDRPTAAQLVEIFEVLAQNADDMAMRRFCRTLVAEAKANEPELETGDPLCGTIVDEDVSEAMGVSAAGVPQTGGPAAPDLGAPPPPPLLHGTLGATSAADQSLSGQHPPVVAPPPQHSLPPNNAHSLPPAESGGSGMLILGAVAMVVVVVVVVVLLGGGGVLAALVASQGTTDPVPVPTPITNPDPVPVEPEAPATRIVTPDSRTDVKKAATTLSYSDPTGGEVTIKGAGGFHAEWDGKAPFDLGEVGDGRYKTLISLADGSSIRGKSFTVDGNKKTCSFTFDVSAKDWTGSCK